MARSAKTTSAPVPATGKKAFVADRDSRARFATLLDRVRQNRPEDVALLQQAFDFAAEQHQSQTRESGEPYLSHPLEVALILADLRLDVTTLIAALLHDVVEDTHIPLTVITERFGPDVARLVEGVTKISRIALISPEMRQAESVRKMLLAMVTDVRVVLVKLADRLHNMRTLNFLPSEKQERIARETLDIYAPIAHRLGMGLIRGDLEDLAFKYLEPAAYQELEQTVADRKKEFEKFLNELQDTIRKESGGKRHSRRGGRAHQAALFHPPESQEAETDARPGLRSAGGAHHYRLGAQLLRRPRRHTSDLASRAGPFQRLHRDAPPQPVSIAAYHADSRGTTF